MKSAAQLSSSSLEHTAQIKWSDERKKYDLVFKGKVLVSSKDKGYLNYLVIKQKHSAILNAGVLSVEILSTDPSVSLQQIPSLWGLTLSAPSKLEPRKRGRKRKHFNRPEHVEVHHVSDRENDRFQRSLLPMTKYKIRLDYREYLSEGVPHKKALEEISRLYEIEYAQAFSICDKWEEL